ncbi:MAG: hypothetical protein EZS28_037559 [Streblomastix strix]|uniref:Uncharacterized protein n=1 Tax=Streblomastix strix TaxID=222440 RepID=A0A5J4U9L3_9EUKA|nr:MAG: hypothetical protein EZS28_037559 [Streblomastix strix]
MNNIVQGAALDAIPFIIRKVTELSNQSSQSVAKLVADKQLALVPQVCEQLSEYLTLGANAFDILRLRVHDMRSQMYSMHKSMHHLKVYNYAYDTRIIFSIYRNMKMRSHNSPLCSNEDLDDRRQGAIEGMTACLRLLKEDDIVKKVGNTTVQITQENLRQSMKESSEIVNTLIKISIIKKNQSKVEIKTNLNDSNDE